MNKKDGAAEQLDYLRKFFDTIKSATDSTLERVFVTGELKTGFPTEKIGDPDNFVSLLYYFGMVTIAGQYKGKTKFVIPNQVVREQIFRYLLDTYKENDLQYDSYEKGNLEICQVERLRCICGSTAGGCHQASKPLCGK